MGYSTSQKGFIFYDPCSHKFHISRNVVLFKNQYFFPMIVDSSFTSPILPTLEDLSSYFNRFKPRFVYERCRSTLSYPSSDPPPKTVP